MGGKKKYIEMFGSFTEPFIYSYNTKSVPQYLQSLGLLCSRPDGLAVYQTVSETWYSAAAALGNSSSTAT